MTVYDLARALPDIATLRDRSRALATLDAILSPEWEYRYFSFDAHWGPGEEMASMRDGSGNEYSIVFGPAGVFVRGLDHESPMSPARGRLWPGLVDSVPAEFASSVTEPAFSSGGRLSATVCLWRRTGEDRWSAGVIEFPDRGDDGADQLFGVLAAGTAEAYREFAEDYYERPVDAATVAEVFALRPLTDELVRRLNPELSIADLADDLHRIGYPG